MNETMRKFGHPGPLIREYDRWCVLLRPQQATLGALVLACKDAGTQFSDVSADAMAELHAVIGDIEAALGAAFGYDKINYLMLMMVDPDVHFHVLPRYAAAQTFAGPAGALEFEDAGWPGPPRLDLATETDADANAALIDTIKAHWPTP